MDRRQKYCSVLDPVRCGPNSNIGPHIVNRGKGEENGCARSLCYALRARPEYTVTEHPALVA